MGFSPHSLGDVTAEVDKNMLNRAYYETQDYQSLSANADHCVVVGRRGTGKSALCYKLNQRWSKDNHTIVLLIAPEDHELMALRHYIGKLGENSNILRSAAKTIWRYALILEVASLTTHDHKCANHPETAKLGEHLSRWNKSGSKIFDRVIARVEPILTVVEGANDLLLARLIRSLDVDALQGELDYVLTKTHKVTRVVVDRLDEGFEPTIASIAMIAGAALSVTVLNSAMENLNAYVFIRDNIAREIAEKDPDYSRNLESRVLRLHWEEQSLFYMICRRLRQAFNITDERDLKVWDKVTAQDVSGRDGFRKCLRLTLYRPRDLILLLNKAFYRAGALQRTHIDNSDISSSAKEISENRKRDLINEYSSSIPGLDGFIKSFSNTNPNLTFHEACERIDSFMENENRSALTLQTARIIGGSAEVVKLLYSVGFLGVIAEQGTSYIFSHDGKTPMKEFSSETKLLIHPCYWMALNLLETHLFSESNASEIHDDLDLEVTTDTTEMRNKKLGQMVSDLEKIPMGASSAKDFEDWCERTLRIVFPESLDNIRLHPNGTATQRRDVVATNTALSQFWKRVLNDYGSRQVIFEVKNYSSDLGPNEYRQMATYLGESYGKLGFIIARCKNDDVRKDAELEWVREMYYHDSQKKLIIKLSASTLTSLLSKLRNPEKFSVADKRLNGLLDKYETNYLSLGGRGR